MLWLIKCPMIKSMMHFHITGLLNWDLENRSYTFNDFLNWWLYKKWLTPARYQISRCHFEKGNLSAQKTIQTAKRVEQHNQRASQDMLWYSVLLTSSSSLPHNHLCPSTYSEALSFSVHILWDTHAYNIPVHYLSASTRVCFKLLLYKLGAGIMHTSIYKIIS
jgi:carbohydrate-binding DOMON domain-containing protein